MGIGPYDAENNHCVPLTMNPSPDAKIKGSKGFRGSRPFASNSPHFANRKKPINQRKISKISQGTIGLKSNF